MRWLHAHHPFDLSSVFATRSRIRGRCHACDAFSRRVAPRHAKTAHTSVGYLLRNTFDDRRTVHEKGPLGDTQSMVCAIYVAMYAGRLSDMSSESSTTTTGRLHCGGRYDWEENCGCGMIVRFAHHCSCRQEVLCVLLLLLLLLAMLSLGEDIISYRERAKDDDDVDDDNAGRASSTHFTFGKIVHSYLVCRHVLYYMHVYMERYVIDS